MYLYNSLENIDTYCWMVFDSRKLPCHELQ